ncbi:response regulator [Methylobacterium planeticum]|uniref:Response regulator n=1 Tax=Methylobacterium planeticum TaxID=2615211 RepID=A0A6N6MKA4_9HYPH|nr:response regulator [Methylobacterium planeticum]KAB1071608.1 response regulator [Methylobacterium planeticum]
MQHAERLPRAVVAEDEPLLLLEAADMLHDAGFEVFEASTANAALRHLEEQGGVTLLFTDVRMPPGTMDGFALARAVAERWPHVTIVICSAIPRPDDPSDLPGDAHFLGKPFLSSQIRKIVSGLRA